MTDSKMPAIPEEAIELGAKTISGGARGYTTSRRRALLVLDAAAPLIVAAELERQADSFDEISYHRVADLLRERAAELRGGES